ncbi:tetratricopeptide repeat protein [Streptosporangium carneum]|uniref:ATP/GTP-binding protein n=1 Tax=Streptosporangium carneum TaxID=47481 RepID=A0A9W6MFX7_9ACTN|nr:tetratricopeptide repeat protein [Streptosporangium carneum]GLK12520.1 ATP/GTP-binding protein [Streptosporangium carneum]
MNHEEEPIPLTFAEVYRRARAAGALPPFDLQRGLDDLRAWIDREVDIVETGDLAPAAVRGPQVELRGRRDLLEELMTLARRPGDGPAVLVGVGGAGKSALAEALTARARSRERQTWWVPAADLAGFSAGLAEVARELGGSPTDVESIAKGAAGSPDRLWRLLENAPQEWLLVLDNADNPWVLAATDSPAGVQDGLGWARASRRGLVVVTSRETDPRMWGAARLFTVDRLSMTDAAQVLRDLAPEAGDEAEARALARRLDGLPLTLHLAGTYLGSEAAQWPTFAEYAHALGSAEGTVVSRTAEISLDGLARHGIPQARKLLRLASCYAPTSIPTRILSMTGMEEALDGLRGVGLIQKSPAEITLHPVVTDTNRAHLEGPEVRHIAVERLVGALRELRFDLPDHWPRYRMLSQHLLALLDNAAEHVDREHLALLVDAAGVTARAFIGSGAGRAAGILCEAALTHRAALGEEHPAALRAWHYLAWTVADGGDPARAEAIYRNILDVRLRTLGEFHPDTISSRHEFAWIATCLGRWAEAERRYRDTLRDSLRYLGPDEPATLTTHHELAWAIARQGHLAEALSAFRNVLRDRRRVLGNDHPQTLQTEHDLAWITAKQGKWAEAEAMYRDLLRLRQVLETDHPHVLLARHELAWTIARQGRWSEAESGYRNVLELRGRTMGDDHPETEATRWALSELLQGRVVDADHLA